MLCESNLAGNARTRNLRYFSGREQDNESLSAGMGAHVRLAPSPARKHAGDACGMQVID